MEKDQILWWTHDQWKAFGLGVFWILLSFAVYRFMQFVARWYLFGKCTFRTFSYFGLRRGERDSRTLSSVPPNKKWRISNEAISLFHSVVSGLWAAYALLFYKELAEDLINYRCDVAVNLIFMSGGYLIHDLIDLLVNEQSARIMELLFHHIVVLTAFAVTLISKKYLGVVVFGLLMELNSIFLHSRSLLNLYGENKKSALFRMVALLNMLTLLVFRMFVSAYLIYWAVTNVLNMKWYLGLIVLLVILSLGTTNTVLAYRVMAADGLLGKSRARKSPRPTESTVAETVEGRTSAVAIDVDEEEKDDGEAPHEVAVQTEIHRLVDDSTQADPVPATRTASKTDESEDSRCSTRRNSLRQSVRSPQSAAETIRENAEQSRIAAENLTYIENNTESLAETPSRIRNKPVGSATKNLTVRNSVSKSPLKVNTSFADSPLSIKSPKGKEGKLLSLREENNKLNGEIKTLKKEIDLWNRRLMRGSRFAKFKKEMKPLEDKVKELEQERKHLNEDMDECRERSERAVTCVEKTLSNIKTVLVAAKIPFTEGKLSSGKNAAIFLKNLPSKEKTMLIETLKQRKFVLDLPCE